MSLFNGLVEALLTAALENENFLEICVVEELPVVIKFFTLSKSKKIVYIDNEVFFESSLAKLHKQKKAITV